MVSSSRYISLFMLYSRYTLPDSRLEDWKKPLQPPDGNNHSKWIQCTNDSSTQGIGNYSWLSNKESSCIQGVVFYARPIAAAHLFWV